MAILDAKMEQIRRAGIDMLATGNPGCMFQFRYGAKRAGLNLEVVHPVELLARARLTYTEQDLNEHDEDDRLDGWAYRIAGAGRWRILRQAGDDYLLRGIALIMNAVSYWFSDKIVLRMYGARQVTEAEAPCCTA